MWFLYSGDRHVHVCAAEEQPHSSNGRGGGGLPRYSQTVASAHPCRQRHIPTKATLCFYFPFQEICVVAPATDPYWRGSRLSLWSVNTFVSEMCKSKDKAHMQITPFLSSRRADAVGAGAWATAAVWLMGTETRRARTVSLMYNHFFTTCFHICFIVFTMICWLWFSGSHIFIQRRWLYTNWPHAGGHFPSRTNGKQQIPLSIKISPRSSPKMLKHSPVFCFNTVV